MKKVNVYLLVVSVVVVGMAGWLLKEQSYCEADGTRVCYDLREKKYTLEENAALTIYVKNQEEKDYVLGALARDIVDYNLTLDVQIQPNVTAWQAIHELDVDVFYTNENQAAMMYDQLMPIEESLSQHVSFDGIQHFGKLLNQEGIRFVPSTYEGLLFAYNETLLDQLGFDVAKKDDKNRIEQLNEWDEVLALSLAWQNQRPDESIVSVFPFSVAEPWQFYPFLTAGGWQMFPTNEASNPGFDTMEFFDALVFIEEIFTSKLSFDERTEMDWRFEEALLNKESLFSLATEWLDWEAIAHVNKQEYSYSAFLDHHEQALTPLVKVDGLVIKDNPYPSLSHRIFEVLTRDQHTTLMIESSEDDLVIARDKLELFEMEEKRKERIQAYMYSVSEPLVALENNPQVLGWQFYLDGHVHQVIMELFHQNLTVEQAQLQLIEDYQAWYTNHNVKETSLDE